MLRSVILNKDNELKNLMYRDEAKFRRKKEGIINFTENNYFIIFLHIVL